MRPTIFNVQRSYFHSQEYKLLPRHYMYSNSQDKWQRRFRILNALINELNHSRCKLMKETVKLILANILSCGSLILSFHSLIKHGAPLQLVIELMRFARKYRFYLSINIFNSQDLLPYTFMTMYAMYLAIREEGLLAEDIFPEVMYQLVTSTRAKTFTVFTLARDEDHQVHSSWIADLGDDYSDSEFADQTYSDFVDLNLFQGNGFPKWSMFSRNTTLASFLRKQLEESWDHIYQHNNYQNKLVMDSVLEFNSVNYLVKNMGLSGELLIKWMSSANMYWIAPSVDSTLYQVFLLMQLESQKLKFARQRDILISCNGKTLLDDFMTIISSYLVSPDYPDVFEETDKMCVEQLHFFNSSLQMIESHIYQQSMHNATSTVEWMKLLLNSRMNEIEQLNIKKLKMDNNDWIVTDGICTHKDRLHIPLPYFIIARYWLYGISEEAPTRYSFTFAYPNIN